MASSFNLVSLDSTTEVSGLCVDFVKLFFRRLNNRGGERVVFRFRDFDFGPRFLFLPGGDGTGKVLHNMFM